MATKYAGDETLVVEFFTREITKGRPRTEEWVRVANPVDPRSELVARADSVSLMDPDTGEAVTYAERFSDRYAAFLGNKGESTRKRIGELEKQLAAARNEANALPDVSDAEVDKAVKRARENARAAEFAAMGDDELRAYVADRGGKQPGPNTKRETLERMAQELNEG